MRWGKERLLLKGEQWSLRRYRLLKLDSAVGTQEDEVEGPSQGVREQGLMPQLPLVGSSSRLRQILTTERQCVCVCVCVCVRARACVHVRMHIHAKSLQLCPTLCDPMDSNPPGSSAHGILQARIIEWVSMPFSRGSFGPRD